MLGTIEDLEKNIEQFQSNVAVSGEMTSLLKQMLEQIKQQNSEFNVQTKALITRVEGLPITIENANAMSNSKIKSDVSTELERTMINFGNEQNKYLQGLDQTKQQIQGYIEQSQSQEKTISDKTITLVAILDGIPAIIEAENAKSNTQIKNDVSVELEKALRKFSEEQGKYISSVQETQNSVKECESQLVAKYKEFKDNLEKINISNLYDQNMQLKNEINKRTTILMIISGISVVLGIVGFVI
jgi:biopolymer transport protein ExbB/TolQ